MYSFLSGYTLTIEPGVKFQYSNLGMSLLGHALALKAGTNFESLLLDRKGV
jgi:serine-type D-Ala-D-Ala carboxypeptidase/endopeptidase